MEIENKNNSKCNTFMANKQIVLGTRYEPNLSSKSLNVSALMTEKKMADLCKLSELGINSALFFHELKNIISRMNTATYLTRKKVGTNEGESLLEFIDEIDCCLMQMNRMSDEILSTQQQVTDDGNPLINVNSSLDNSLNLLKKILRVKGVSVIKRYGKESQKVRVNELLLSHVFLNIINNAVHAMEKNDGERILEIYQSKNKYGVSISIKNSGPSISLTDLPNIFKPFYTTKESDKGTGLGLYFVKQNMEKWGGTVSVRSKEGEGTSFILYFPYVN